jgi:hypothetical protein
MLPHWRVILYTIPTLCSSPTVPLPLPAHCPIVPWQCCTVSPSLTSTSIDASGWSVECCHIGGSFCTQFPPSAHRPLFACHYPLIARWSPGSVVQSPPHSQVPPLMPADGVWNVATLEGHSVHSSHPLRIAHLSAATTCSLFNGPLEGGSVFNLPLTHKYLH